MMELPFVDFDAYEQNADIANVKEFLVQARRVLCSDSVSEEMKKNIFDVSMECIGNVKQYYKAKHREIQLEKADAELNEKLHHVENELTAKESIIKELRSSIEEKKLRIRMSQMNIERSRERVKDLLRQRNELEEKNKQLKEQTERNNAAWTSSLRIACEQRDRLNTLMEQSPRIAKQNNERDAVNALAKRLEELQIEKVQLQEKEGRLRKELELQTATPLRVFMVNFAKITLRTMEMQEKLKEAKKIYAELKAEEAEKRKKSGEFDVFDASFMSQDISMRKVPDVAPMEMPKKLPTLHEMAEDESATSESHSSSAVEPPRASSQDIISARTEAVKNYVEQQSESVASGLAANMGDSDTGERDNEECSMLCNQEPNSDSPEMDVEVTSNDEQICEMPADAANMDETVDENEGAQNQEGGDDFSDDDSANVTMEEGNISVTMEEDDDKVAEVAEERFIVKQEPTFPMEKARLSQPSQESRSSQRLTQEVGSQKMSQGSVSASQRSQPNTPIPQRQASDHNKVAGIMQTPSSRKAKDAGKSLNDLVGGESSPIQEDIPFSLSEDPDKEVFDPTAALNISANSNDPGADFLSLMETTNEKKAKSGRNRASPDGDFSFSIFGAAAEGGATSSGSGDGEFAFDFGNPTQDGDGADDGGFQFNFGGSEEQGNDKDEGFNLFGF